MWVHPGEVTLVRCFFQSTNLFVSIGTRLANSQGETLNSAERVELLGKKSKGRTGEPSIP